jgi:phosphate acetyltransferase
MNKAIYIATSEQNSGKSIITLGLMSMLIGKMAKVGYFRPIIEDFEEGGFDNHRNKLIGHLEWINLKITPLQSKLIKRKQGENRRF